ncbi:hypothetical protein, partial [Xylella fastidiosa]
MRVSACFQIWNRAINSSDACNEFKSHVLFLSIQNKLDKEVIDNDVWFSTKTGASYPELLYFYLCSVPLC